MQSPTQNPLEKIEHTHFLVWVLSQLINTMDISEDYENKMLTRTHYEIRVTP